MKFKSLLISLLTSVTLLASGNAMAQEVSVRAEAGLALPLTTPQSDRFSAGWAAAIKPELTILPFLSVGPAVQFMWLDSVKSGVDNGTAWSYGGFVRVKRPYVNTGALTWGDVSPWVDTDAKYVRSDGLDRFGWAAGVGVSIPTSERRALRMGPFFRYDLVNQADGKAGVDTNSAKTYIGGLSFEFSAPAKQKPTVVVQREPEPPIQELEPTKESVPPTLTVVKQRFHIKTKVQFAWDSAVLKASEDDSLSQVLMGMNMTNATILIEGHASSEGQVEHNDKLSLARAEAVLNWLADHGVARDRMTAEGFGSQFPRGDNKTEAGRVTNRRVEFDVTLTITMENDDE